jgi:dephospho-CoA kinase
MIIGLTGAAFAGKDTAGFYLSKAHNFAVFAFADPIRDGLKAMLDLADRDFRPEHKEKIIAWVGKSPRQLMQLLGSEWGRDLIDPSIWTKHMAQRIALATQAGDDVVITDVRFKTESDLINRMGGEVWRILRPGAETTEHSGHRSEREGAEIAADRLLMNSGTVEQMYEQIDEAIGFVFGISRGTTI